VVEGGARVSIPVSAVLAVHVASVFTVVVVLLVLIVPGPRVRHGDRLRLEAEGAAPVRLGAVLDLPAPPLVLDLPAGPQDDDGVASGEVFFFFFVKAALLSPINT
jgi:hypothetical protein